MSEDLVTYGGTCPKCFAEIPGDEAPTDPGAEVRAAQDRKDRRGRTLRIAALFAVLIALVSCTGVSAIAALLWPKPQVADLLDFDTLDMPMPDLVGAPTGELAGPNTSGGNPSARPTPSPTAAPSGATTTVAEPASPSARPRPSHDLAGPADPTRAGRGDPRAPSINLSLGSPTVNRDDNTVLSDPDAIRMMIGEYMQSYIKRLQVCYDRRLKVNPDLKGKWLLSFTVQPNGHVESASATGIDRKDAELEGCMVDDIRSNWKFGKITVSQPVKRTITLVQR